MNKFVFLYFSAIFASLGGLLSGYDTGVISGAFLFIDKSFQMNSFLSGTLVASVSLGALFGAFLNGLIVDKIGRRKTLLITALIFIFGSVFCFFAQNIVQLIFARVVVGCAVGVVSFAGPLYLSEISIKEKRGQIVSFHQIAITLGILFSYLTNFFCANLESNWRVMLLIGALPALVLLIAMFFCPDTPRWYVLAGKIEKAKAMLLKIDKNSNVDFEINEICSTLSKKTEKISFKKYKAPFIIGIGIMFVQIATGINAIIYYAPVIFKMSGFQTSEDALFVTIFIGVINFLMTFVAFFLVDKLGRKPLLYIGLSGMLLSLIVLASVFAFSLSKYLAIVFCAFYIVSFSMSLGPVALLIIAEVFPLAFRAQAMSIAIVSNFVFNFIVTGLFPVILGNFGPSIVFIIFALICILSMAFVYKKVPETKGVSLEDIEKNWV